METRVNDEECTIRKLYDAAKKGCVVTLNTLLQKDQFIIHKISLTPMPETPLHISALLGHLEFTEVLLTKNPSMASELDSLKRSPLHLASAEGHTEVVKALLRANNDVCMNPDQDDRIPLHFAAMRGRVEVIQALVRARPDSTSVLLDGDSVFHLCVKYNHLEALKRLLNLVNDDQIHEVVRGNKDGNTILHLAVMSNQAKTVQYLLSVPGVKEIVNALNKMNFTSLDTLDTCQCSDFKSFEIRNSLREAGARRANTQITNWFHKIIYWIKKCHNFLREQGNTIEDVRGSLMIVATVIATMSFQAAISPPKNFESKEDSNNAPVGQPTPSNSEVIAKHFGFWFFLYNTLAFISSLTVVLLVIGGFPVRNKIGIWCITLAMVEAVTFTVLGYLQIVQLQMRKYYYGNRDIADPLSIALYTLLGVQVGVLVLNYVIRGVFWVITTLKDGSWRSWRQMPFPLKVLLRECCATIKPKDQQQKETYP